MTNIIILPDELAAGTSLCLYLAAELCVPDVGDREHNIFGNVEADTPAG